MKKSTCILVVCIVAAVMFLVVFLSQRSEHSVENATADEVAFAKAYRMIIPEDWQDENIIDNFLKDCMLISNETTNDMALSEYSCKNIDQYLFNYHSIVGVSMVDDFLYINYNTTDGKYVVMCYSPSGFNSICVYEEATDTAIALTVNGDLKYNNFRYGSDYTRLEKLLHNL